MTFEKGNTFGKANKGHLPWSAGKPLPLKTRQKLSTAHKGKKLSEKTKKKLSIINKGKHLSNETKRKISLGMTGRYFSDEHRRNMSLAKKGKKHPNWQGGISSLPYSVDWTKDLKRAIRKRDQYTCQICGKEPAIDCHHIDYDKKNCNPINLITLCRSCHIKTNTNRKKWIKFFKTTPFTILGERKGVK